MTSWEHDTDHKLEPLIFTNLVDQFGICNPAIAHLSLAKYSLVLHVYDHISRQLAPWIISAYPVQLAEIFSCQFLC
jgi:hypothetical protein